MTRAINKLIPNLLTCMYNSKTIAITIKIIIHMLTLVMLKPEATTPKAPIMPKTIEATIAAPFAVANTRFKTNQQNEKISKNNKAALNHSFEASSESVKLYP